MCWFSSEHKLDVRLANSEIVLREILVVGVLDGRPVDESFESFQINHNDDEQTHMHAMLNADWSSNFL